MSISSLPGTLPRNKCCLLGHGPVVPTPAPQESVLVGRGEHLKLCLRNVPGSRPGTLWSITGAHPAPGWQAAWPEMTISHRLSRHWLLLHTGKQGNRIRRRMASITSCVAVFLLAVPITTSGQACQREHPRPVTVSRNARRILQPMGGLTHRL